MRYWPTVVCVAIVAVASWSAKQIAATAWQSVVKYKTPYQFHQPLPGGAPLASRVVLVVLDGVRLDLSRQHMPFLNSLRRRGADGVARVGQPSLSNPGRAVMVTGAWQEINGVTFNSGYNPITLDTVFSLARAADRKTAVSSSGFWQDNFASEGAQTLMHYPKELHQAKAEDYLDYQRKICEELPGQVWASPAQFLAVDLTANDDASHDLGPLSEGTLRVLDEVDRCLQDIVQAVDLKDAVVIATADHGHIDSGGHGGAEESVVNVPLVLAGGPVRPGATFQAQQTDIAPTICALLGLPLPATNQGRVLLEALNVPDAARKDIEAREADQAAAFRGFQTHLLGGTSAEAKEREQRGRILPAVLGALLATALCAWLFFGVLINSNERWAVLAGLAAFYGVYFLIFRFSGLAYSFSAVNREEWLPEFFLKDMLAAGIALLAAAFVTGRWAMKCGWAGRPRLAVALTLVVVASFTFQLLAVYWLNGIFMTYWMLDLRLGIWAYFNLLAIFALGFAMLLSPLALVAGQVLRKEPPPTAASR